MFKSKARKLLAVAMILAVALSLQIPSFAAPPTSMVLSLEPPTSGTANQVNYVVTFTGVTVDGTVTMQYYDDFDGTYKDATGFTSYPVAIGATEVVFADMPVATTDVTYRALYGTGDIADDLASNDIVLDPESFNRDEFTKLNYSLAGTDLMISTSTFELGTTGTVDISKSTDGGTTWTRITQETLTGTETVFSVSDTYPTQETLYRIYYGPSDAELLKGYSQKYTIMPAPYKVGLFTPVTISGYGKDPAGLTATLDERYTAPGVENFGLMLNQQEEDGRLSYEVMSESQALTIPAGYSLFAAVDIRLTSAGREATGTDTDPFFGPAGSEIFFEISGLRPGSSVAVIRTIGDTGFRQTIYPVDETGSIITSGSMPRELNTATVLDPNLYTSDNSGTLFIYTNYAPTPAPTPAPVPVSPSTGVYN